MVGAVPFFRDDQRPFAQRDDGMSLDTIQPKDVPQGKVMYPKSEDLSLKTQDIRGARPHYDHLDHLNKPDLSVGSTNPVHAGARARTYYANVDRRPRDLSLTTADIEMARAKPQGPKGNRHTDPVNPQYDLPSSYQCPPTPPRFSGRHTNDISDIERSKPKPLMPPRSNVRDPNEVRDIEYASVSFRERNPRHPPRPRADRSLDVSDIMGVRKMPPRDTNPMEPVYKVPTNRVATSITSNLSEEPVKETEQVGEIRGSKPRKLKWDNGEPQLSLQHQDISGATPQRWIGSKPHSIYDPHHQPISFHDPNDIPGAQVGSLKRGITSQRNSNPLNPSYPMLDGEQRPLSVIDAERGGTGRSMPRSGSQTRSLPNLHTGALTPSAHGSSGFSSQAHTALDGYTQRPSRTPLGRTPSGRSFAG